MCFTQKEERRGQEDTITHAQETFWCFRFDPTFNKIELELNYLLFFFNIQAARQPQNLTRGDFKSLQIQTFLGVIKSPKTREMYKIGLIVNTTFKRCVKE